MGMMHFVHSYCPDIDALTDPFRNANNLIQPRGFLVITAFHPFRLHEPHAAYETTVTDSTQLQDGDPYTATLFDIKDPLAGELKGEHFWFLNTVVNVAREAGFRIYGISDIEDVAAEVTSPRKASKGPAYTLMVFNKPAP